MASGRRLEQLQLHPQLGGRDLASFDVGDPRDAPRIEQHRDASGLGRDLAQQLQPFARQLPLDADRACHVAAGAREARDMASLDRIRIHVPDHDGYGLRRSHDCAYSIGPR